MQNLLIKFSKWLNLFSQTIASMIKILIMSKNSSKFRNLKTNKDKVVILGNGPSLKSTIQDNMNFLQSKELICVNHFGISDFYTELKPAYYITIAYDLFLDDVDPQFLEASNNLFNTIADKTTWKLKFLITNEAKKYSRWRNILENNNNIEIIYINITPIDGFKSYIFRQFDKANGMPRPHNIMIPSIFTALHLKPKEIILIGAEHSWLKKLYVDDDNNTYLYNEHFYDSERQAERFNLKGRTYLKLHEFLKTLTTAFESYHVLNEYAKKKNIEIINCTESSYIDAFKRSNIKNIK